MNTTAMLALRYLTARKLRAVLTTMAVVFGVAVIFAGNVVLPSALDSFRRTSLGAAGAVDLSISATGASAFASEPAVSKVAAVEGVAAATGVLQRTITVPVAKDVNGQAVVVGVDPATIGQVRQVKVVEGRFLQPGDTNVVVFGGDEAKIDTTVNLPTVDGVRPYTVVGKLETNGVPSSDVYMPLPEAQTALGLPNQITGIEVALVPGADRAKIEANALAALGPEFRAGASSGADAVASLDVAYAMFNMLGALALFIGAFLIFNTFRTIVLERKRDLAMLRAIGATRGQVTTVLVIESLLQGVIGSVLGLVVGAGMALLLLIAMRSVAEQYLGGVTIEPEFSLGAALPAVVAGIVTTLLAGYLPARAAGRVSPLEVLRPTSTDEQRRAARWNLVVGLVLVVAAIGLLFAGPRAATGGALLFLIGLAVASPALIQPAARLLSPLLSGWSGEGEIAEGNLRRQPGRAAVTASTLMIGLAAMVMISSLIGSFTDLVVNLFNRNFASDIILLPQNIGIIGANLGAGGQLADELRQVPGVATVGTLRTASASAGGKTVNVDGIDPATYQVVSPLQFEQSNEQEAYAALEQGDTAIVNGIFAAAQNLRIGDTLTLESVAGTHQYRIVGIGGDALSFKLNTVYVSQATLAKDFGKTDDVLVMLKLAPDADQAAVEQQVRAIAAKYPQFNVTVTADFRQNLIDQSLNILRGAFIPLSLVILLPAALGLLNTLTMSVLERTREIGITRAIGASRRQVRRIVVAEALLLGIFGAACGALAGLAMSYGFTAALSSSFGMTLPFNLPVLPLLIAITVGLLLTLLVSALPARTAARLDILQALRYE